MSLTSSIFRLSCLLLLLATITGCGRGNTLGRQNVSGKVTLDGAPLDQGTIAFSPEATSGSVGSGAMIKNGEYSIPILQGLPPGKYVVRINAAAAKKDVKGDSTDVLLGPGGNWMGAERIAPRYNVQSQITVDVVAETESRFDFDTKSK